MEIVLVIGVVFILLLLYAGISSGANSDNSDYKQECEKLKQELEVKTKQCEELKEFKTESLTNYKVQKSKLEEQIAARQDKSAALQKHYNELQRAIENHENDAQEKYNLKLATLQREYADKDKELSDGYQEKKLEIEIELEALAAELSKLRSTKAATIEAFQREEAIKNQKDLYRINLSESDENDIKVLQSIECRLNNPRVLRMLIWQTFVQPITKKKFPQILGSKKVTGIYKITNIKDEKCYIGQGADTYKRWSEHCKCGLGIDTPQGNKLYAAMREDGISNFTFELLEQCTSEELDEKEKFFIEVYNSVDYGYNSQQGNKKKVVQ